MKIERILMVQNWITSLRSGKYEQARGGIRRDNSKDKKFCCLGVLCDISGQGDWHKIRSGPNQGEFRYRMRDTGKGGVQYPPTALSQQIGLARHKKDGKTFIRSIYKHLAHLNDYGSSFDDIASEIEEIYAKELKEIECLATPLPSRTKRP